MKRDNTVGTISLVMIITLAGKLLALVRDSILARSYGVGLDISAFFLASRIPRVFFDVLFASAITMSFIPVFTSCKLEKGDKEAHNFANIMITYILMFLAATIVLGIIFAVPIVDFMVEGDNAPLVNLASKLIKILFPTILFAGATFSFIGILQANKNFIVPASVSVVFNLVIISYLVLFNDKFGVSGLAIVFLIGWFLQMSVQIPSLRKIGYRFRFNFDIKNPYMTKLFKLMLPVMVVTWVQPVNILVNTKYATGLYKGSGISAIDLSNNLYTMLIGVFILSVMNVMFPSLSELASNSEEKSMQTLINSTVSTTLFIVVPLMFGVMTLSKEIILFIYSGKNFDSFSVGITTTALFYFTLGMVGYAVYNILSRYYFALHKGKLPMVSAISAIVVNLVLCIVLVNSFGVAGLTLSASLGISVGALILAYDYKKKSKDAFGTMFFIEIFKTLLSAGLMSLVIVMIKPYFEAFFTAGIIMKFVGLMILAVIGMVVYGVSCHLLKIKEFTNIKMFIKQKIGRVG